MAASADPLDGFRRAFEAAGYACQFALKRDFAQSHGYPQAQDYGEDDFRALIVQSIRDTGRPVIAFGVVGPPECSLITGYDEGGDVLIGWSFFQDEAWCNAGVEFEPSGYFRKRNWFADTHGLILIGDKQQAARAARDSPPGAARGAGTDAHARRPGLPARPGRLHLLGRHAAEG